MIKTTPRPRRFTDFANTATLAAVCAPSTNPPLMDSARAGNAFRAVRNTRGSSSRLPSTKPPTASRTPRATAKDPAGMPCTILAGRVASGVAPRLRAISSAFSRGALLRSPSTKTPSFVQMPAFSVAMPRKDSPKTSVCSLSTDTRAVIGAFKKFVESRFPPKPTSTTTASHFWAAFNAAATKASNCVAAPSTASLLRRASSIISTARCRCGASASPAGRIPMRSRSPK
mmetsp:Transcript_3097/g.9249  ORF Transcript_3097/g.9249 Transcript_3097/m.9249 type:complete len:229 (+) Transcript_3097:293-979(+)